MKREHAPNPGVTWDTRLDTTELIIDDPDDTTVPGMNNPLPPRENRATRRAKQRAARRNR